MRTSEEIKEEFVSLSRTGSRNELIGLMTEALVNLTRLETALDEERVWFERYNNAYPGEVERFIDNDTEKKSHQSLL